MNALVTLAGFFDPMWEDGWLFWWQLPVILLLVGLIIFWVQYRKRQM